MKTGNLKYSLQLKELRSRPETIKYQNKYLKRESFSQAVSKTEN